MQQKYIERLEQVVRVLKELPKTKRFDLEHWGWRRNGHGCKTAGCAVGWACSDKWFKRRGLTSHNTIPQFRYFIGWDAAREFFGLDFDDCSYLFSSYEYVRGNRADVYRRIEKFINTKRKENVG